MLSESDPETLLKGSSSTGSPKSPALFSGFLPVNN